MGDLSAIHEAAAPRGSGINQGFLAPLTPFRHYLMGEESMERAATVEETARIKAAIKEAVAAGAFGFTTTTAPQQIGYKGRPLACRNASLDEYRAFANALRELGRGAMEVALTKSVSIMSEEEYQFLDLLLTVSGRPVTWLALINRDDMPEACQDTLPQAAALIRRDGVPQVTCRPLILRIDLRNPFIFANLASWNPVFNQSMEMQAMIYCDASLRNAFREALKRPDIFTGKWGRLVVKEVFTPSMKPLEGRSVAELADERGKDGVDTFLDLALEDDLQIQYTIESSTRSRCSTRMRTGCRS
jgi:N-acyl-D-aspartate/D-glutamate deacylase